MKNISLLGLQYDDKSSFMRGSRLAPHIIKEKLFSTSSNTFSENHLDITEHILDVGNEDINSYFDIEQVIEQKLAEGFPIITLGGDHSITFPIIKAYNKHFSSFDVIHLDAHPDLYDTLDGDRYSHACPFARIMEDNLIDNLIQVGIRTWTKHQREQAINFDVEISEMKNFNYDEISKIENDVYISLDMDVFDPAFAPGVSHHEPGGLSSREVIRIIQMINTKIIGADIVEYNPKNDNKGITAALAAKMVKEISSKIIENG